MLNLSLSELDKFYDEAEQVDRDLFAEMRSNLLLVAGEHYNKNQRDQFTTRIRESRALSEEQKLRLTKNHMGRISGLYLNTILEGAPGVHVLPDQDSEAQDRKSALLNNSVWKWVMKRGKLQEKIEDFAQDFVDIGECACKVTWDHTKGDFLGYQQLVDELGMPAFDMNGQPVADESNPIFSGDFVFERIYGFDLLREACAKDMNESRFFVIRKMVNIADLKKKYSLDEEKLKMIQETEDETYHVFDSNTLEYSKSKNQVMVKEFYFRPSVECPEGYFYFVIMKGVLESGPLPYGIFPIVWRPFLKLQKTPRGRSKIKQLRPYQIEINRTASAIATHQVTLGDDKLVGNNLGKIEQGAVLPGVRFIKTNLAGDLKILPGRGGEQYMGYMTQQINEMYDIAGLSELNDDNPATDPFMELFKSVKQKKKFKLYISRFEAFLVELCEVTLKLAKEYLPDYLLIPAIGRKEIVNIAEFRSTEDISFRIKVEPRNDDFDTLMGRQLAMNHTLQYVGSNLEREDIGRIIKNMPFGNLDESFSDFTMDYEIVQNDILALERGEPVEARWNDNHDYMIKRLNHRMKNPDFKFLDPQIQQNFANKLSQHEEVKAMQLLETQRAQAGFIPTGGYMVKCDFYAPTPEGGTKRVSLPYESVQWLLTQLEAQGLNQEALDQLQASNVASIAQQFNQGQTTPQIGV